MVSGRELTENIDVWVYFNRNGNARLTVMFEPTSGKIILLRWNVRQVDELRTYEQISARYPKANFMKKVFKSERICIAPFYCARGVSYWDDSLGLRMTAKADDGLIDNVAWSNPEIFWEPTPRKSNFKSCFQ